MKQSVTAPLQFLRAFILFAIASHLIIPSATAQYALNLGGTSFDKGVEVGVDDAGNAYFVGTFNDTLDFDPGVDEYLLKNLNTDVFVASYDPFGDMRFAFKLSGNHASHEDIGDIAVAGDGSFVVTGSQPFGFIDFDPDPIEEMVRTGELYIAAYTSSGNARFAVSPNGGQNTSAGKGFGVALDKEGNVYATGFYATQLDFNPADTTGVLPNQGNADAFIASYTPDGEYRFAYGFGGTSFDTGTDIVVDSQYNVYVAGFFASDVEFDPRDEDGDGDKVLRTAEGGTDMYLVSYDDAGRLRFVYTYDTVDGVVTNRKIGLSIDGDDNIYISGESHGTVAFDPEDSNGDGNLTNRTAEPLGSAYIASYSPDGVIRFATVLKGGSSLSKDVFTDKAGNSFMTGTFGGDIDFDPNVGEAILSSSRGTDVFVASYDQDGNYRTAFSLPSNGLSGGSGVAADSAFNVLLTGGFTVDLDVERDAGEDWRLSAGQDDIFMARFTKAGEVSVSNADEDLLPGAFEVMQPYPNPTRSSASLGIKISKAQQVKVSVFDLLGREVQQIQQGMVPAGEHKVEWDATQHPGGVYFMRVDTEVAFTVRQIVVVK